MQGQMQGQAVTAEGGIIKVSPFRAGGETSHGNSNYELFLRCSLNSITVRTMAKTETRLTTKVMEGTPYQLDPNQVCLSWCCA